MQSTRTLCVRPGPYLIGLGLILGLLINSIAHADLPAPADGKTRTVLATFAPAEGWGLDGQGATRVDDQDDFVTELEPTKDDRSVALNPGKDEHRLSENPTRYIVDVTLEAGDACGLAMVLVDAEGEEFGLRNLPLRAGANTLTWDIPTDITGSWGVKGNGKPDGKVRVSRLLPIRYNSDAPARVRFTSLQVDSDPNNTVNVLFASFAPEEAWGLDGQGASRLDDDNGFVMELTATNQERSVAINPGRDENRLSVNPTRFTVEVMLEAGNACGLAMVLVDAEGEEFGLRNLPLQPGANNLTWDIPTDITGTWGAKGNGKPDGEVRISRLLPIRYVSDATARLRFKSVHVETSMKAAIKVGLASSNPLCIVRPATRCPNSLWKIARLRCCLSRSSSNSSRTGVSRQTRQSILIYPPMRRRSPPCHVCNSRREAGTSAGRLGRAGRTCRPAPASGGLRSFPTATSPARSDSGASTPTPGDTPGRNAISNTSPTANSASARHARPTSGRK